MKMGDSLDSGRPKKKVRFTAQGASKAMGGTTGKGKARRDRKSKSSAPAAEKKSSPSSLDTDPAKQTTLRDLERIAYAPASLHSYKSDPLHKHKRKSGDSASASSRGQGRPARGARGGFGARRGQPNIKLRMSAMLERIKRDYT